MKHNTLEEPKNMVDNFIVTKLRSKPKLTNYENYICKNLMRHCEINLQNQLLVSNRIIKRGTTHWKK